MATVVSPAPVRRGPAVLKALSGALQPLLFALVLAAIVLAIAGHNPLEVYRLLFIESFGSTRRIASTLAAATPLIFTGLATAIAFRTGAFNVGLHDVLGRRYTLGVEFSY